MADYYSVLKKTVAALPENTGAARRAIYQRARTAIVNQLKAYDPPLAPSEITNEQLRLEEAIRKVEAEAARETLGLNRPPAPPPAPAPVPPVPEPASPAAQAEEPSPEPEPEEAPPATVQASAPQPPAEAKRPVTRPETMEEPSLPEAREPHPENSIRREPAMDAPGFAGNGMHGDAARGSARQAKVAPVSSGRTTDAQQFERVAAEHHQGLKPSRLPMVIGMAVILMVLVGIGAVVYSQRDAILALIQGGGEETPVAVEESSTTPEADTPSAASNKNADRLLTDDGSPAAPDARTVTTTRISPPSPQGGETPAPQDTVRSVTPEEPQAANEEPAGTDLGEEEGADPALEEPSSPPEQASSQEQAALETPSVASEPAESPAATPSVPQGATTVAQRSILYEEGEESNGSGTASPGQAVWSVDKIDEGGKEVTVLKIEADITDRNVGAEVSIKPNSDSSLPASHLVEVKFDLPPNFPNKGVADVPGLVMKMTEEARGDALVGASVKVADGYFWVALSNVPSERERNLALLKERGWIDIPILYEDGKRAILTLEKGTPGTRAVDQALAAWQ
ncbi:hypothetical protein H2509_08935 [Stappia sp. F7233]|uniref:CheA signal transduction histidine kinase n=1 Tax=Stappia albiluteola TaxID=2758565 RepID=A0A839AC08_9HYPH|nr:hypothetical protein [Stappia albiluteola]MBA5777250.1 hypothetical protein [Stappia albiluteola]